KPNATDALSLRPQEQPNLGLTKAIDRLHRVAHREQRAPIARLPACGEAHHQLVLTQRGILKLVDEQMSYPVVQRERELRRRLGITQRLVRRQQQLREV